MKQWMMGLVVLSLSLPVTADLDDSIELGGDILAVALPLTALTATYTLDDPKGRQQLLLSYGTTLGLTYIGKYATGKERPDGSNNLSFPSAHTSSAFSGASFMARRYGWDIGVPAFIAASFVGYSRVVAEKHDWWDVGAGAALAVGINHWLVSPDDDISVGILPYESGLQFSLAMRF